MTVGVHEASVANGRLKPSANKKRFLGRAASSTLIWCVAALTMAGTIGIGAEANAATYWSDTDYGYSQPAPMVPQRAPKVRRHAGKKNEPQVAVKESAKPQGPLIIAISINKQSLKVYDDNGFFAETPISTGMRGHATPMGAFSVIQKQKMHRSNIYSGAPMPFMQRITWSGIAMHAGVLPGYPASHGCIRMPMAFAVKMYGWTKMGARVVVTPNELTPESFSHPLLATQKVVPQPVAADAPKAELVTVAKADKAVGTDAAPKTPAANTSAANAPASAANLELRSTVGHDDKLNTVIDAAPDATSLREQTHTADAGASSTIKSPVTMSDATPSSSEIADTSKSDDAAKQQAESVAPASSEAKLDEIKAGETVATDVKAEAAAEPKSADAPKADAAKADDKASTKPAETVKADAAALSPPDANKDQGRPVDAEKAAAPKPNSAIVAASKRSGPISVFISRKDAKLYVRQNFAPLFEVPVTIAPGDRPLGTHIFTAEVDKNDANVLRWSVVSLPSPSRYAERRDEDERISRKRKMAGAAEIKPMPEPDSPAEALDRLSIPADVMARITEDLSTGGSIIVSDQGIAAGETGEGTDFIVSLR
jgi:lipoprotein-anchoring transpeptidase ErfK/SrfK